MADRHPSGRSQRPDQPSSESVELRRLRKQIDALDRRIVRILNERAELGRAVGRQKSIDRRRAIRDRDREREVFLRVAMANTGPLPQAEPEEGRMRDRVRAGIAYLREKAELRRLLIAQGVNVASVGRPKKGRGPRGRRGCFSRPSSCSSSS